jgi:hypothetical protein
MNQFRDSEKYIKLFLTKNNRYRYDELVKIMMMDFSFFSIKRTCRNHPSTIPKDWHFFRILIKCTYLKAKIDIIHEGVHSKYYIYLEL